MKEKNSLTPGTVCTVDDLGLGQSGVVISLENDSLPLRRRLLDMGITKGVVITIRKFAPFRDPVVIELRGYELCLRRKDLKKIGVKAL